MSPFLLSNGSSHVFFASMKSPSLYRFVPSFRSLVNPFTRLRFGGIPEDNRSTTRLRVVHRDDPIQFRYSFGPIDPKSNIRPIRRQDFSRLTRLQQEYCKQLEDTWKWLDHYWACHNTSFKEAKQAFLDSRKPCPSEKALDLSEFYTQFLTEHRSKHLRFNFEWYRRILRITILGMLVELQTALQKSRTLLRQLRMPTGN